MASIDLFLDGVGLSNGNVVQLLIRVDSITGDGVLIQRLIDAETNQQITQQQFPEGEIPDGAGPSFILPFGDGGYGVLLAAGLGAGPTPEFQAFDSTGQPVGGRIQVGFLDDGGTVPVTGIVSVLRAEDGTASVLTQTTVTDPADPDAEQQTFNQLRTFNLDGTISEPIISTSQVPVGDGLALADGTFVIFAPEPGFGRPSIIANLFDASFQPIGTSETVTRISGSEVPPNFAITVVKEAILPGTGRTVVVWSQFPANGEVADAAIFFGFGRDTGTNQRLSQVTRLAPTEIVSDNFEVLALPDGTFVLGWTQNLSSGTPDPLVGAQVVWQQFNAQGVPLGPVMDVPTPGPSEIGVSLELLGTTLLVSTSFFTDLAQSGTALVDTFFPLDLPSTTDLTDGPDVFSGDQSDEVINGLEGNDQIDGAGGNDTLNGGLGDDTLIGGAGADVLDGGTGSDTASYVQGTSEVLVALQANIGRGGEAEGDTFVGIENVLGTGFNDRIIGDDNANSLGGAFGSDVLVGFGGSDTLDGGDGDDVLAGGFGADTLLGGAGQDTLTGNNDADRLEGGAQADLLNGGNDNDALFGGSGSDSVIGGGGDDTLFGGTEGDFLNGSARNDELHGDAGDDTLFGGNGQDTLFGGAGIDDLAGGTGIDQLFGGTEDDTLAGGSGQDTLEGGAGSDFLSGGAGLDLLDGGLGDDNLGGGANGDRFRFAEVDFGADIIRDFGAGDVIDLSAFGIGFGDLTIAPLGASSSLISFTAGGTGTIQVSNVAPDQLTASDFDFIA